MAYYEVKTQSTFENVYYIEAETKEEAEKKVADTHDFMQKHLHEVPIKTLLIDEELSYSEWYQIMHKMNYF